MTGSQATSGGVLRNHSNTVRLSRAFAGHVTGCVHLERDRRERGRQIGVAPGQQRRQMLGAQPRPQLLVGEGIVAVDEDRDEAAVRVVESELDGDTVGIAPVLPLEVVEKGVDVVAPDRTCGRLRAAP